MASKQPRQRWSKRVESADVLDLEDADMIVRPLDGRSGWAGLRPNQASTSQALRSLRAAATGGRASDPASPPPVASPCQTRYDRL